MKLLVGLLTLLAVACGPSSKEVAGAKTARYTGDKLEIFHATKAVVEGKYKLQKSDETTLGMQTTARWYSPEGLVVSGYVDESTNSVSERDIPDKAIRLALVVTMLPDGSSWILKVTPVMLRKNVGMPKPDELKEDDPSVPGWVGSRADELALDIHKALAKYEVKQPGGMAPPPAAPGPAPDEPAPAAGSAAAPAAPAAGSAAP
jgi:hypothetical protein